MHALVLLTATYKIVRTPTSRGSIEIVICSQFQSCIRYARSPKNMAPDGQNTEVIAKI